MNTILVDLLDQLKNKLDELQIYQTNDVVTSFSFKDTPKKTFVILLKPEFGSKNSFLYFALTGESIRLIDIPEQYLESINKLLSKQDK